MIYLITYSILLNQNRDKVYDAIKSIGEYIQFTDTTWFVDTKLNTSQMASKIKPYIMETDLFMIIKIDYDFAGHYHREIGEWLLTHWKEDSRKNPK